MATQSEDQWHVEVEPGEVKIMSLEQLDDLYRLEVISASTKVWQPGMTEWLPLAIIAGLEDEVEEIEAELEVDDEPPKSASSKGGPLPAFPVSTAPPPPSARPSSGPPAPSSVPAASKSTSGPSTSAPPSSAPSSSAPSVSAPSTSAPSTSASPAGAASHAPAGSLSPHSITEGSAAITEDTAVTQRGSVRIERTLVSLAIAAGVLITMYRNDVLLYAAKAAGQTGAYEKVESAVGSPGFGTPRSLKELRQLANSEQPSGSERPAGARPVSTGSQELAIDANDTPAEPAPETPQKKASEAKAPTVAQEEKQTASTHAAPRPKQAKAKNIGVKGSSNEYDPLNPQL